MIKREICGELERCAGLLPVVTFLRLLAGRVGQVANLESLSGDVGVSATTLKSWLSVLEASFINFTSIGDSVS